MTHKLVDCDLFTTNPVKGPIITKTLEANWTESTSRINTIKRYNVQQSIESPKNIRRQNIMPVSSSEHNKSQQSLVHVINKIHDSHRTGMSWSVKISQNNYKSNVTMKKQQIQSSAHLLIGQLGKTLGLRMHRHFIFVGQSRASAQRQLADTIDQSHWTVLQQHNNACKNVAGPPMYIKNYYYLVILVFVIETRK